MEADVAGLVIGVEGVIGAMVGSESGSDDGDAFGTSVSIVDGVVGDDSDSDGVVVSIAVAIDVWSAGVVVSAESRERSSSSPDPHAEIIERTATTSSERRWEETRFMRTG